MRLGERARAVFAPPSYLSLPLAGMDLSPSGIKAVRLAEGKSGLTLARHAEVHFPARAYSEGEIIDRGAVIQAIRTASDEIGSTSVTVGVSESRSAYAIEDLLSVFDAAGVAVQGIEEESFAFARALVPAGNRSGALVIDIGKTATKIIIIAGEEPRFASILDVGGHAFTLAVQKHFGVTEAEARRIKVEEGMLPKAGSEEYLAAMHAVAAPIRHEVAERFAAWQEKAKGSGGHEPITQVLLAGGNASVRGFAEYVEARIRVPVHLGNVFTRFAPRDEWIPELEHQESFAYAGAIGLALRSRTPAYA